MHELCNLGHCNFIGRLDFRHHLCQPVIRDKCEFIFLPHRGLGNYLNFFICMYSKSKPGKDGEATQ